MEASYDLTPRGQKTLERLRSKSLDFEGPEDRMFVLLNTIDLGRIPREGPLRKALKVGYLQIVRRRDIDELLDEIETLETRGAMVPYTGVMRKGLLRASHKPWDPRGLSRVLRIYSNVARERPTSDEDLDWAIDWFKSHTSLALAPRPGSKRFKEIISKAEKARAEGHKKIALDILATRMHDAFVFSKGELGDEADRKVVLAVQVLDLLAMEDEEEEPSE